MNIKEFIENIINELEFEYFDGTDTWKFYKHLKVKINNSKFLKIATSNDGSDLLIEDNNEDHAIKNLYVTNQGYFSYYCFSFTELFHRKQLVKIYNKLRKSKSIDYINLLEEFSFDLGCLYWVASGCLTSEYDEKIYNKKRNEVAIVNLIKIAEENDPRACSEVASYYSMENPNSEQEFNYLKKATIKGDYLSKKKLVEYIIEERNSEIKLALSILTELQVFKDLNPWTNYTEANIYLKGIGIPKDLTHGLHLLKESSNQKNPMAMADYSYFLFNGIGIEEDKNLAKNILLEANQISNGRFKEILDRMN